jgi:predicted nuclease with TOPRIM domain
LNSLKELKEDIQELKNGQKMVIEQTAHLTEFTTETKQTLEDIREENGAIYEAIGKHEISINRLMKKTS